MVRKIIGEFIYILCNYIVNNIPIWYVRKLLYTLLGMKIGAGSRILMKTIVVCPWKVVIGNRTIINEFCYLDGRGELLIGDDVSVSIFTKIITGTHISDSDSFEYVAEKIIIGNNVWIGADAVILPGTTLPCAVIIGAGSTVLGKKIYQENSIYSGIPAIFIKCRNLSNTYELNEWNPFFR